MRHSFSICVVCLCALSRISSAQLLEGVADFESISPFPPFPSHARFGGSWLVDQSNGIDITVEAVNFTGSGVIGDVVQFPDNFPQPLPDNSGSYLAHGRPTLTNFVPVGTKGFYLRADGAYQFGNKGDLFDLVSIDLTNFVRLPANAREYHPATVQLTTAAAPIPYTRGMAGNGWMSVTSPGNLADEPGKIKFETVLLADSTSPTFPAEQYSWHPLCLPWPR